MIGKTEQKQGKIWDKGHHKQIKSETSFKFN